MSVEFKRGNFSSPFRGGLLDRVQGQSKALSETQSEVDQLVGNAIATVADEKMMASLFGAGLAGRFVRLGSAAAAGTSLAPFAVQGISHAVALASESAVFAGMERKFASWEGHAAAHSFQKDWARAFINLGCLKLLGGAAQGQNLITQHFFIDTAMVAGHQLGYALGFTPRPQGTLAQQLIQAEGMNLAMKGSLALLHGLSPRLSTMERSLHLALRSHETSFREPNLLPQFAAEGPEGFFTRSLDPAEKERSWVTMSHQGEEGGAPSGKLKRAAPNAPEGGSGDPETDATYADLRRINQTSVPVHSDSIPEGSRKIAHGEKTLYLSPKALEEMAKLDRFVAEQDHATEIFGFGLTRPFDHRVTLVTDFITPREGKVVVIGKGMILFNDEGALIKALSNSETLRMAVRENQVWVMSNKEEHSFPIEKNHWNSMLSDLQKVADQELPGDWDVMKDRLERGLEFSLKTDWDLVVSGGQVNIMDAYVRRVAEEAGKRNSQVKFAMHHHPVLGFFPLILQDMGRAERIRSYEDLLAASPPDIGVHLAMGVDWFEIRGLGTVNDLSSRAKTTSVFHEMSDLRQTLWDLQDIVDPILKLSPSQATPENLFPLVERLRTGPGRHKHADTLLRWAYRDLPRASWQGAEDGQGLKELILSTLFSSRDLPGDLRKLIPPSLHPFQDKSSPPAYEDLPINLQEYSILEGQNPGQSVDLALRPLGQGLFGFEGFGFMIFQGARGRLRNCGLIYCSRLAIFDPTTRIAVDSHLPVYFDDFDVFKADLERSIGLLRLRRMNLESSQITLIYGRVVRPEDRSRGWYPGEKIAEMLKDLGVGVSTAFPADRTYDFNLETGEIAPAPEDY